MGRANEGTDLRGSRRDVVAAGGLALAAGITGCVTGSSSEPLDDETVTLGMLFKELSEPVGYRGQRTAAELAAKEIRKDGGIAGADVELVYGTSYSRLHREHDVDVTIGEPPEVMHEDPLWPITHDKVLHLTTGTRSPTLAEQVAGSYDDYKYHFRVGMPNTAELAGALAAFIDANHDALGWSRAAINGITSGVDHISTSFGEAFRERFPSSLELHATREAADEMRLYEFYEELADDDVDVLFTGISQESAVDEWVQLDRPFDLGGLHQPATNDAFWHLTDGGCRGLFSLSPMTPETEHTDRTRAFVDSYREFAGADPPHPAATVYDAIYVYRRTIERGETNGKPPQEAVIETLVEGEFTGETLYDTYEFRGPDHEYPHEPAWESMRADGIPVVEQWQADEEGGRRAVVAPERHRTSRFRSVAG